MLPETMSHDLYQDVFSANTENDNLQEMLDPR